MVATLNELTTSTFVDNMSQPIHRWFRYSAGFSARWAERQILEARTAGPVRILDPFSGAGTVLIESERCHVESIGVEAHPFVSRVARAKLSWREDPGAFLDAAQEVATLAKKLDNADLSGYPSLVRRCFPDATLLELDSLKRAWSELSDASAVSELVWLAITTILRACSPVGTAQWQYVLPNKTKAGATKPSNAFRSQVEAMAHDIRIRQMEGDGPASIALQEDARDPISLPCGWANLVITSPPYMNNYDYADATRLEMSFWGEIDGWGQLHEVVRRHLVRSCTQHVAAERTDVTQVLRDPNLAPISERLAAKCAQMAEIRMGRGGRKPYHAMAAAYFSDLALVWRTLRDSTTEGCTVCFVVGDSAPYGVHIPVEQWLGELALSVGFKSFEFRKTRDRNTKWKNRKHGVPLHEGQLWVKG